MFHRNKDFNFNNYVSCKSRFVKLYGYKILNITFLSLSLSRSLLINKYKKETILLPRLKISSSYFKCKEKSTRSNILFQEVLVSLQEITENIFSVQFIKIYRDKLYTNISIYEETFQFKNYSLIHNFQTLNQSRSPILIISYSSKIIPFKNFNKQTAINPFSSTLLPLLFTMENRKNENGRLNAGSKALARQRASPSQNRLEGDVENGVGIEVGD